MYKIFKLLLLWQLQFCASYKILLVFPFPSRGHAVLGESFVKLLLADGHEITYVTQFPMAEPPPKLRQIDISPISGVRRVNHVTIDKLINKGLDHRPDNWEVYFSITKRVLSHDNVKALLEDEAIGFDAVVADWMFSEVYAGFAAVYDCPLIWSISTQASWLDIRLMDETPNPSYSPYVVSDGLEARGFWARWQELWAQWRVCFIRHVYYSSKEKEVYLNAFTDAATKRGRSLPPLDVMRYNASLMLGSFHASVGIPVRLPQSYKPVGGFHIDGKKLKIMSEDLKRILDESSNGVIYFSLGTQLDTTRMPLAMKGALLKIFKDLKQTVLWKHDEEPPANVPGNVHMMRWIPQQSVLAHPNTKLFITHGGTLSLLEAAHFAIATVVVPTFGDQFLNAAFVVNQGMGKRVLLTSDFHVGLKKAVLKVLGNKSYKRKAKEVSFAYHNRLRSPRFEVKFWIKHVIKTRGAPHLRSPALLISWYQKCYLDLVILVICALVGGIVGVRRVWVKFPRSDEVVLVRKRKLY